MLEDCANLWDLVLGFGGPKTALRARETDSRFLAHGREHGRELLQHMCRLSHSGHSGDRPREACTSLQSAQINAHLVLTIQVRAGLGVLAVKFCLIRYRYYPVPVSALYLAG